MTIGLAVIQMPSFLNRRVEPCRCSKRVNVTLEGIDSKFPNSGAFGFPKPVVALEYQPKTWALHASFTFIGAFSEHLRIHNENERFCSASEHLAECQVIHVLVRVRDLEEEGDR